MRIMKKILLCMQSILLGVLTLAPLLPAPQTQAQSAEEIDILTALQTATYHYQDDRGIVNMPYRYYFPSDYNADCGKTYPIVLFLHGAGERGTDNSSHVSVNETLFKTLIGRDDCIIIAPQCAAGSRWVEHDWGLGSYTADEVASPMLSAAMDLLRDTMEKEAVDPSRVYAMGLSMGAFGVWDMLIREPDLFAAAIPSEGAGDPSKAELLVDIPIRTFHGALDTAVPVTGTREMVAAIKAAGGEKITYKEYPDQGHGCWYMVWADPGTYTWLFAQVNESKLPENPEEPEPSEDASGSSSEPQETEESEPASDSNGKLFLIAGVLAVVAAVLFASAGVMAFKKKKKK